MSKLFNQNILHNNLLHYDVIYNHYVPHYIHTKYIYSFQDQRNNYLKKKGKRLTIVINT